ncbi:two pore potassium channel protein sup-9 [Hydra vulgaris]|uniref:Two pore potassium channel protein sup-9 n=1 Tax=Hydra vulgaris TaxID=6087 RepID=A0ABM4BL29_HYDVU
MMKFVRILLMMLHRSVLLGLTIFCGMLVFQKVESMRIKDALHFCWSTITTIGYGAITPKTHLGKVLTMLYSIIGIPLFILCLSSYGMLINHCTVKVVTSFDQCCSGRKKVSYLHAKTGFVLFWVLIGEIIAGTFILNVLTDWSMLDSAYTWVITLTTIGFGDYIPDYPPDSRYIKTAIILVSELTTWATIASFVQSVRSAISEINNERRGFIAKLFCCYGDKRDEELYFLTHDLDNDI